MRSHNCPDCDAECECDCHSDAAAYDLAQFYSHPVVYSLARPNPYTDHVAFAQRIADHRAAHPDAYPFAFGVRRLGPQPPSDRDGDDGPRRAGLLH